MFNSEKRELGLSKPEYEELKILADGIYKEGGLERYRQLLIDAGHPMDGDPVDVYVIE